MQTWLFSIFADRATGGPKEWNSQEKETKSRKFGKAAKVCLFVGFPGGSSAKNLPANTGDIRDVGSIPGSGRAPGGQHGSPLQYFCLENPRDREAWKAIVHRVAKSQTWLKQLSIHTMIKCTENAKTTHIHTKTETLFN